MSEAKEIFLSDYTVPDFLIDNVKLDVDVHADHTRVTSKLELRRNPKSKNSKVPLFLNGENQRVISVALNGKLLTAKDYKLSPHGMTLAVPDKAVLELVTTNDPKKNTALSGLYASGPMLCTQCEAEGFRRITYYPDRPDVMAKFYVTIHADKKTYPVLLSNGNLVKSGAEKGGRHFAIWEDPFPKPCYLFAMVAGKLDKVTDKFITQSGRKVLIEIYTEPGRSNETAFALAALKKSMKWDELTYGLEYDLDRFMLVATPFFNMGAMENKGLNIFNDACVLGRAETATDATISFIERVVGHEYFHNWTGDRITCRDWFQLSLKEGLTVFREQEFMGDVNSRAVERLGNVRVLRRAQYAEDAGAMAHPVRPDRYQAIDNFYTATVYEKGSEVVRMIQTMVGKSGFRAGMDTYIHRHDGQAVTCDDFVAAMSSANKIDLKQFMLWYSQAGTPVVKVTSKYNSDKKTLTLSVKQSTPATPGQKVKKPLHIPLAIGMLDEQGRDMIDTKVVSITKASEDFVFKGIKTKPVLSLLRDFSAPVRLIYPYTDDELLFLLAKDSDPFCRWEAGSQLLTKYMLAMAEGKTVAAKNIERLVDALGNILRDNKLDAAFKAMCLAIPTEGELGLSLAAEGRPINPDALYETRKTLIKIIADALRTDFGVIGGTLASLSPKATDGVSMGKRSLKNLCLSYRAIGEDEDVLKEVFKQATTSVNMTDQVSALGILGETKSPLRDKAFAVFEKRWKKMPTIMDKWLSVQASAKRKGVLKDVKRLMQHSAFSMKNPNRISALIGAFAGNIVGFHAKDGSGYRFIADMIIKIDPINPHSAASLCKQFARWKDYDAARQKLMVKELERLKTKKLSANSSEIVIKSLK